MNEEQLQVYQEFLAAKAYLNFAIKRRDSKNVTSTLKESHPPLKWWFAQPLEGANTGSTPKGALKV